MKKMKSFNKSAKRKIDDKLSKEANRCNDQSTTTISCLEEPYPLRLKSDIIKDMRWIDREMEFSIYPLPNTSNNAFSLLHHINK